MNIENVTIEKDAAGVNIARCTSEKGNHYLSALHVFRRADGAICVKTIAGLCASLTDDQRAMAEALLAA